MIDYIFRIILCSGFFVAIYYVLLQNERMHLFNRFYLIFSGLLSFVIPTLKFKSENPALEQVENIVSQGTLYFNDTVEKINIPTSDNISWETGILLFYAVIVLVLLIRFIFFNRIIRNKVKQCDLIPFGKATLALTYDSHPPHSYWKYIFVPKSDYEKGLIDKTIIDHELAHIRQKHTLDIWLIDVFIIVLWFNPFFYLVRNAIRLNHEFLADESVVNRHNISDYRHLILLKTADTTGLNINKSFSCSFNYLKTKKRLEMMTKQKTKWRNISIQSALVPVLFSAIVLFSDNSVAQEVKDIVAQTEILPAQNQTNSEEELQKAFDELLKQYIKEKNGKPVYYGIDKDTQKKLIPLYEKMSKSQKERQIVQYMPGLKKRLPSKEEFETWKDPKICGVWLNGVKVNNDQLNNFEHTDIAHYFKSTLAKNAKYYGKYVYHLDARTNENFEAYNKKLEEEPYLVFWPQWRKNY